MWPKRASSQGSWRACPQWIKVCTLRSTIPALSISSSAELARFHKSESNGHYIVSTGHQRQVSDLCAVNEQHDFCSQRATCRRHETPTSTAKLPHDRPARSVPLHGIAAERTRHSRSWLSIIAATGHSRAHTSWLACAKEEIAVPDGPYQTLCLSILPRCSRRSDVARPLCNCRSGPIIPPTRIRLDRSVSDVAGP